MSTKFSRNKTQKYIKLNVTLRACIWSANSGVRLSCGGSRRGMGRDGSCVPFSCGIRAVRCWVIVSKRLCFEEKNNTIEIKCILMQI